MSISLARGAVSFVTNAVLLAVTVGYSRVQTIQQVCEKREWLVQPDLWPESLGLVAVSMLRAEGLYCCVQSSTLCNYKWKCSPAGRLGLCLFAQGNYRCSSNNAKKLRFEFFFESASWITRLTNKKFSFATWFIESPFHDNRMLMQLFTLKKFIKRNAHPPKNCMPSISSPELHCFLVAYIILSVPKSELSSALFEVSVALEETSLSSVALWAELKGTGWREFTAGTERS